MITQETPQDITDFIAELQRQEVAPKTIASYRSDLLGFARWFTDSTSEAFTAAAVTPTDVRDYRACQERRAMSPHQRFQLSSQYRRHCSLISLR